MKNEDAGRHYRFTFKVTITKDDTKAGHKTIKLDPFRIAKIYGMTSFPLMTTLKKVLCAGNRGHKDYMQDLLDISSAINREIEIVNEDLQNGEKESINKNRVIKKEK